MQNVFPQTNRDEAGLIQSIRNSASEKIRASELATGLETERLLLQHETEILDIQKKNDKEIEVKIKQEVTRIINRAQIEKKKLQLNIIESFCKIMTKRALAELSTDAQPRYRQFFVQAALEALSNIRHNQARIIFCAKDDKNEEIRETVIQQAGENSARTFETQNIDTAGGLIVEDLETGRIYNASIDRIRHRKQGQIRKAVFQCLSRKYKHL